MMNAGVGLDEVAEAARVDPKTAQRWIGGRVPHPRHRMAVASLVSEDEAYLWPGATPGTAPGTEASCEIISAYAHRADVPSSTWGELLASARHHIDLLGYAFLFLPEQHAGLAGTIKRKCAEGCRVRALVADPDGAHVGERDDLEMLGGTLPARIRMTLHHLEPMLALPDVELRLHNVHLYNAIYRFDDQMIVTPYLYRAHGYQHPALHLRRLGPHGLFASFAEQYDHIWSSAGSDHLLTAAATPGV
ncbi:MAG: XRE family transcriptional regulator [bacterium]|nr:XRE family transcriptional regulator [bacterium]